jgi:drug/metabolite transporter (DMT)-like permease
MNISNSERLRQEIAEESQRDLETEKRTVAKLRRWTIATVISFACLLASVFSFIPFLKGHALHDRWDPLGKDLLSLAMGIFLIFMFIATITISFASYLKAIRQINRKYAAPGDRHRL